MRISEAVTSAYKALVRFCSGQAGPRRGFQRVRLLIGKFRFLKKFTTNEASGLLIFIPT